MTDWMMLANLVDLSSWRYLDDACRWAVVLIGVASALALYRKLGAAVLPFIGLFVLIADSHLYWARVLAQFALLHAGCEDIPHTLAWRVTWQLIPVGFAGVMAAAFIAEIRRCGVHRDTPS